MEIRNVEISNWRGISHLNLSFTEGLNIIHGPNESGKSSIHEAVRACLLRKHSSNTKDNKAVRPWATRLKPVIKMKFHLAGSEWSVVKTFLSKVDSELLREGRLVAKDARVHDKLQELLTASTWSGALWSKQGDIQAADVPGHLRARLVAEETVSPGAAWLGDRLQADMKFYWTGTRRPKKSFQDLRQQTMDSEDAVHNARHDLEESNRLCLQVSDQKEAVERARSQAGELEKTLQEMQDKVGEWDRYRSLVSALELEEEQANRTKQWLKRWNTQVERTSEVWAEARAYEARLGELKEKLGEEPDRTVIESLQDQIRYLDGLMQQRIKSELSALKAPEPDQISRLLKLEQERDRIAAALEGGLMNVAVTALTDLHPEAVVDGKKLGSEGLLTGTTAIWELHHSLQLELPGVAQIEFRGGSEAVEKLLQRRDEVKREYTALLHSLEVESTEKAQQRLDRARELRARMDESIDFEEMEQLASSIDGASRFLSLPEAHLREEKRSLGTDLEEAESSWRRARDRYQQATNEYHEVLQSNPRSVLEQCLRQLQQELESAPEPGASVNIPPIDHLPESWIDNLKGGRAVKGISQRIEEMASSLAQRKAALERPHGLEIRPQDIEARRELHKAQLIELEKLNRTLNQALGRLDERSQQYEDLVRAQEELARNEALQREAELEAGAIRMLTESFEVVKSELEQDIIAPLQKRVSKRLNRITAGRYQDICLAETLAADAIVPTGGDPAPCGDLSFGTLEQLSFVSRLCLAEMLSENEERQSLILDDNLVHTDRIRMSIALELLEEVARSCQIILLTCHPERFEGLKGMNRIGVGGW
jgi:exonuclease SbcC